MHKAGAMIKAVTGHQASELQSCSHGFVALGCRTLNFGPPKATSKEQDESEYTSPGLSASHTVHASVVVLKSSGLPASHGGPMSFPRRTLPKAVLCTHIVS